MGSISHTADTAGNFETLGSKFSHETARSAGILMLLYKGSHISHAPIIFIRINKKRLPIVV